MPRLYRRGYRLQPGKLSKYRSGISFRVSFLGCHVFYRHRSNENLKPQYFVVELPLGHNMLFGQFGKIAFRIMRRYMARELHGAIPLFGGGGIVSRLRCRGCVVAVTLSRLSNHDKNVVL